MIKMKTDLEELVKKHNCLVFSRYLETVQKFALYDIDSFEDVAQGGLAFSVGAGERVEMKHDGIYQTLTISYQYVFQATEAIPDVHYLRASV